MCSEPMKKLKKLTLILPLYLAISSASAQNLTLKPDASDIDDHFQRGLHEASAGAGVLFSNTVRKHDRPEVNYVLLSAELGYMLYAPSGDSFLRGNFEIVAEMFGAEIYGGPGNYIVGAGLLLRYNFVPKDCRWVPHVDFGGGGSAMDIPHSYDGKSFNFHINADAGLHYFIRPNLALNADYLFQHISNADLWSKNVGVNTSGPVFGVSLFF
jgi:hypothetical protein